MIDYEVHLSLYIIPQQTGTKSILSNFTSLPLRSPSSLASFPHYPSKNNNNNNNNNNTCH